MGRDMTAPRAMLALAALALAGSAHATPQASFAGFPGPWKTPAGELTTACVPYAERLLSADLALGDAGATGFALAAVLNSGVYGAFETPVTFHKAGLSHAALYDAASVYHPNGAAVPLLLAGVPRRPAAEATAENANAAALVAFHRVTAALFPPAGGEASSAVLRFLGVDPDDASTDVATPVGVGNAAAAAALASVVGDGMNALGTPPYADYAYAPSNSPYALTNLTRWQPLLESDEKGYFVAQSHIAPQAGVASRWLTDAPAMASEAAGGAVAAGGKRAANTVARAPPPYGAEFDEAAYRAQAQAVLDASANLTDEQKMAAEWWENKFTSFGTLSRVIASAPGATAHDIIASELHTNCLVDAINEAWREKIIHDAVRPVSVIQHLFASEIVNATVRGEGVREIPGREWQSYLRTMPHSEYPSGTSCVCAAFVEFYRLYTRSPVDVPPYVGPAQFRAGCSFREPGRTPATDFAVEFKTWDAMLEHCAQSRIYAGVHFQPSINAAVALCAPLGRACHARFEALLTGEAGAAAPAAE